MNTPFRPVSYLLSLAALTIVSSSLSVRAETPSNNSSFSTLAEANAASKDTGLLTTPISFGEPLKIDSLATQVPSETTASTNWQEALEVNLDEYQGETVTPSSLGINEINEDEQIASETTTFPSNLDTSAASLTKKPQTSSEPADSSVAQTDIDLGQATRGGSSYIGIGLNIGFTDDGTPLGDTSFVINSKIGLSRTLSVRPSAQIGDDAAFLLPVTYDFVIQQTDPFEPVTFAPFVGGGVVITTADDDNIGFLVTGGVDVPLNQQFVANATLNLGFIEDATELGLVLGIGYTFAGF